MSIEVDQSCLFILGLMMYLERFSALNIYGGLILHYDRFASIYNLCREEMMFPRVLFRDKEEDSNHVV